MKSTFIFEIVFSISIGIYQGCVKTKQKSTKEFLIANGRMRVKFKKRKENIFDNN